MALGSLVVLEDHASAEGAARPSAETPSAELDLLPAGGARPKGEMRVDLALTSFGVEGPRMLNAVGLGLSFTPWSPRGPEGMRFLELGAMVYVGDYGDSRHGPFSFQASYKPEFPISIGSSAVSFYAGPRFAWTVSQLRRDPDPGYSLALGHAFGLEILGGFLSVEASTSTAFALGGDFRPLGKGGGKVWAQRGELMLGTNLCFYLGVGSFCRYPDPVPRQVDLAEALRAELRKGLGPGTAADPAVCQAVNGAVSVGSDDVDCIQTSETEQFFCRLTKASRGKAFEPKVARARKVHEALSQCYLHYQVDSRAAGSVSRKMRLAEQYLADPSDLRRVVGCERGADDYAIDEAQRELACKACPEACAP